MSEETQVFESINTDASILYLDKDKPPVPWRSMTTSGAVWAVGAANFGYSWGFYTLMTELPTYFDSILHFNIKKVRLSIFHKITFSRFKFLLQNSILSALPYLAMWLFSILCSSVADWIIVNKIYKETAVRKIFNSIGII